MTGITITSDAYAARALDKYAFEGNDRLTVRQARMVATEAVEMYRHEQRLTAERPVRDDVRAAHTLNPNGYCRCGLTPTLTAALHEQHLREISR